MQFNTEYITLKTTIENLSKRVENSKRKLAYAKKYLDAKEEMENLFNKVEYRLRGSEIDTISLILTAILNDTLYAGTSKKKEVKMQYAVQRNLPSLDIYIENDGFEESIIYGQGGAVANAVSAGLRIFTIIRAMRLDKTLRSFIIFDESDCWIKPEFVGRFSEAISSVAEKIGMQMLYISHHDPNYLAINNTVHLFKDENGIVNTEYRGVSGGSISYIRLKNFMSHTDTYIPFAKGATLLTGKNDLGKSAIAIAFRSIAYGEMKKSFVKHDTKECIIEIGVDNKRIVYTYKIKGNATQAIWQIFNKENEEVLHTDKKQPPEEIRDLLGIKEIEGMDVQISDQKTPVFLINQGPSVRAKILNIGSESKHLEKLMELWKEKYKQARQEWKENENIVSLGSSALAKIETLKLDKQYKTLTALDEQIKNQKERLDKLSSLVNQMENFTKIIKPLSALKKVELPDVPHLNDTERLHTITKRMLQDNKEIKVLSPLQNCKLPSAPTIDNLEQLLQTGKRLSKFSNIIGVLEKSKKVQIPVLPSLKDNDKLKKIFTFYKILNERKADAIQAKESFNKSEQHLKSMFLDLGYCPLCGRKVENAKDVKTHIKGN